MNCAGCGRGKKASNECGDNNFGVFVDVSKSDGGDCSGFGVRSGDKFDDLMGIGGVDDDGGLVCNGVDGDLFLFRIPF